MEIQTRNDRAASDNTYATRPGSDRERHTALPTSDAPKA